MEIAAFAGQVIGLISTYLTGISSGVTNRIKDSAVDKLYILVTERLRRTKIGSAAMNGLEERPDQPSSQHAATSALTEAIKEDQEFATRLAQAMQTVTASQGSVDQGVVHEQINVTTGGSFSMNRSIIANKVNQSRNVRISLGGFLLVAILLGGTGTAIYQINNDPAQRAVAPPIKKPENPAIQKDASVPYDEGRVISDEINMIHDYPDSHSRVIITGQLTVRTGRFVTHQFPSPFWQVNVPLEIIYRDRSSVRPGVSYTTAQDGTIQLYRYPHMRIEVIGAGPLVEICKESSCFGPSTERYLDKEVDPEVETTGLSYVLANIPPSKVSNTHIQVTIGFGNDNSFRNSSFVRKTIEIDL
jgi:hypothetical protein